MHPSSLPSVPLDLRDHKCSITIYWVIIVLSNSVLPLALYFGIKYTTSMSIQDILSIITAIIGVPALWTWVLRSWRLWRNEDMRPIATRSRMAFDFLGWNLHIGVVYITILLVWACIVSSGIRLFSLMLPLVILQTSIQILLTEKLFLFRFKTPFPLSSIPVGSNFPASLTILAEDVCAVDGKLGRRFRHALHQRVSASPPLQKSTRKLDWCWGLSGLVLGCALIAVIFAIKNGEIGFIIGNNSLLFYAIAFLLTDIVSIHSSMGLGNNNDCFHNTMYPSSSIR